MRIFPIAPWVLLVCLSTFAHADPADAPAAPAPLGASTHAPSRPRPYGKPPSGIQGQQPQPGAGAHPVVPAKKAAEAEEAPYPKWGPSLSANVPHPIWLDLSYRLSRKWSFALGLGGLNLPLTINGDNVSINMAALDVRARWHPWEGAFFLGMALGAQKVSGADTAPIAVSLPDGSTPSISTTITASIASAYVTPHLGWLWIWNSGFMLGFDFGVQLPVAPQTTFDIATNNNTANVALSLLQQTKAYQDLNTKISDTGNKIGKLPLPYLTVLRIGWLF